MTQFDFKKLVDAEYLLNNRTNKNIVVIDARGGMLEEGSLMYDKATVVDWTDISLLGEFGGEELGKLLFTSKQAVCNWEHGRRQPNLMLLQEMSNLFECSIDALLKERK